MKLIQQDLDIYRGAAFAFSFAPLNDDGTAVTLSGANARLMIKTHPDDVAALVDLTVANGGLVIDTEHNLIAAAISNTVTAALVFTRGLYDLLIALNGVTYISHRGNVTLTKLTTQLPMPAIGGGGGGIRGSA